MLYWLAGLICCKLRMLCLSCVPLAAGAHAARMLHRVRRAERMLLSYERCGWLDDTPSRLTGRQVGGAVRSRRTC